MRHYKIIPFAILATILTTKAMAGSVGFLYSIPLDSTSTYDSIANTVTTDGKQFTYDADKHTFKGDANGVSVGVSVGIDATVETTFTFNDVIYTTSDGVTWTDPSDNTAIVATSTALHNTYEKVTTLVKNDFIKIDTAYKTNGPNGSYIGSSGTEIDAAVASVTTMQTDVTAKNINDTVKTLNGITKTGTEIDATVTKMNSITATSTELNQLSGSTVTTADLNSLNATNGKVATMQTDVTAVKTNISHMQGDIAALNSGLSSVNARLNGFDDKINQGVALAGALDFVSPQAGKKGEIFAGTAGYGNAKSLGIGAVVNLNKSWSVGFGGAMLLNQNPFSNGGFVKARVGYSF